MSTERTPSSKSGMVRLLGLAADADALFASGALEDLILVVGWAGRAPAWEV